MEIKINYNEVDRLEAPPRDYGADISRALEKYASKFAPGSTQAGLARFEKRANEFIAEQKARGFHDLGKLNSMIGQSVSNLAVSAEEPSIMDMLYLVKTHGGANYGNTLEAQKLRLDTIKTIEDQKRANEDRDWVNFQRGIDVQKRSAMSKIAQLKRDYNDGKIDIDVYEQETRPYLDALAEVGDNNFVSTHMSWVKGQRDSIETQAKKDIKVGIEDTDQLKPFVEIAQEASTLDVSPIYTEMYERGLVLDEPALRFLSSIISNRKAKLLDPLTTTEYNNYQGEIQRILEAPSAENDMRQSIFDKVGGFERDRTPPEYTAEVALIKAEMLEAFSKDIQEVAKQGNPVYADFTRAQKNEYSKRIASYLAENQQLWTNRLKKVIDKYNQDLTKEVNTILGVSKIQRDDIIRSFVPEGQESTFNTNKTLYPKFRAAVASVFDPTKQDTPFKTFLFKTIADQGQFTYAEIEDMKENPGNYEQFLNRIVQDFNNKLIRQGTN